MKKSAAFVLALALVRALAGCDKKPDGAQTTPSSAPTPTPPVGSAAPEETDERPDDLPDELATAEDLTGEGGYLLLGKAYAPIACPRPTPTEETPEEVALYCDNLEERNRVYLQYGEHFQAFEQLAWPDPTVLPELTWDDWDEDGERELTVKYLRHEGTYFDGEKYEPGLVYEQVVYQWDEAQQTWTDIHFHSSGPNRTE